MSNRCSAKYTAPGNAASQTGPTSAPPYPRRSTSISASSPTAISAMSNRTARPAEERAAELLGVRDRGRQVRLVGQDQEREAEERQRGRRVFEVVTRRER